MAGLNKFKHIKKIKGAKQEVKGQPFTMPVPYAHIYSCIVDTHKHTLVHAITDYKEAVKAYKAAVDAERKSRATDLMPKKKVHIHDAAMLLGDRHLACIGMLLEYSC